ncbi:MAG: CapA family protein [Desulfobacteraceae bacterium]|jgi:poly-gamma-glutamate synthesis protein (capsule biosynthesis protein)|nr:MAG: CapA family protein [Desulfobacteraceae bacterium]
MFVGDISLGEHFLSFGHGPRTMFEEGEDIFKNVRCVFSSADFVIGNIEGPLSDIGYKQKDPLSRVFRGSPLSIKQLYDAGVNVVNVANNHSLQHGKECFLDTQRRLQEVGIKTIGLADQLKPENTKLITGTDGCRVCLLAASDVVDNTCPNQDLYAYYNEDRLNNAVKVLSKQFGVVIVILHWGHEGETRANKAQKIAAKKLIQSGADLIVGHHPHVFFEIERIDSGVVAYSIGNFVFDLPWDRKLRRTGILDVEITRDTGLSDIKVWPVYIDTHGQPLCAKRALYIPNNVKNFDLYKHSGRLSNQALKKMAYFFYFILKGHTLLKLRFLIWKIRNFIHQK